MIDKLELEKIIRDDLIKVLSTQMVYHYSSYETSIDKILLKQSLQFSDPTVFNDPFDCNENLLKINHNPKIVNDAISSLKGKASRAQRRDIERKIKNPVNQASILKLEREKFKISCFSEISNEVLMWSHYADKHSGICVGFNFPHKYDEKFILCPVKYLNEMVPLEGNTDVLRTILYWLTTKSGRWAYEKEIRAITKCRTSSTYEYINFDSRFVKEIIFGCKVTDSKINKAMFKIKKSNLDYNNITFKKMEIDKTTFLLKEKILKPSA